MRIPKHSANENVPNPEIVIGLVGPIGVELKQVQKSIEKELKAVGYRHEIIRITRLMRQWDIGCENVSEASYFDKYKSLINFANKFREHYENRSALAALAIREIRNFRLSHHRKSLRSGKISDEELRSRPVLGMAYIIRQFKLPEEIEFMRKIYGQKFIQISVFMDSEKRKKSLVKSILDFGSGGGSKKTEKTESEIRKARDQAAKLIKRDSHEEGEKYGQRMAETFPLGDVFINGDSRAQIRETIKRFFRAFFGGNAISPSKTEYGMYAATGAALRSIDLSRQVGAAIFSKDGEVRALGCNEVPKAFGGTYWGDEKKSYRDYEKGLDANYNRKIEILRDFMECLRKDGMLDKEKDTEKEIKKFLSSAPVKKSQLMDISEFGRIIHAEMCALMDAARSGVSVKDCILFCTTFPCHMCARHIVASGVKKVVFLEPYPKSYAEKLHSDSITFDSRKAREKVYFEPFIGISPRRYRDIFEKKRRKDDSGKPKEWYEGTPQPRIEDLGDSYIENEFYWLRAIGFSKPLVKKD